MTGNGGPKVEARGCWHRLRWMRRTGKRLVSARNRNSCVLLFAWCSTNVLILPLLKSRRHRWRSSVRSDGSFKPVLFYFRRGTLDPNRWCLQRERLWLRDLASVCILDFVCLTVLGSGLRVDVGRVTWRWSPAAGAWGERAKSRSVGCRLRAQLSKVEIGAGLVTHSHRLPELALGPETIEDDSVDDDAEGFDHDLDNATDQSPVLCKS